MSELRTYNFMIDVVGTCQLSCPSCPVANIGKLDTNSTNVMRPEMLDEILKKATSECNVNRVYFYNWTEPLLNKYIAELVGVVKSYGLPCQISSNLNITKRFASLLLSGLDIFNVSVSGFNNAAYQIGHKGGDIEVVKENMKILSELRAELNLKTEFHVTYLRYKYNIDDEFLMKEYAESLGWHFKGVWAQLMPLEKSLGWIGDSHGIAVTDEDKKTESLLALPFEETLNACKSYNFDSCRFKEDEFILDSSGNAILCCAVYDQKKYQIDNYLNKPISELQQLKNQFSICESCVKKGVLAAHSRIVPLTDQIAVKTVLNNYANKLGFSIN